MLGHVGHRHIRCSVSSNVNGTTIFNTILSTERAAEYQDELDDFVSRNRNLRDLELLPEEWEAIKQVRDWLCLFRTATTQMSTTKKPMLSSALAIFRGLQDHLRGILRELPDSSPPQLRQGLVEAHEKLSEYFYRIDESPFYTWSSCKSLFIDHPFESNFIILQYWILVYLTRGSEKIINPTRTCWSILRPQK